MDFVKAAFSSVANGAAHLGLSQLCYYRCSQAKLRSLLWLAECSSFGVAPACADGLEQIRHIGELSILDYMTPLDYTCK